MLAIIISESGTEVIVIFFLYFSACPQSHIVALGAPESGLVLILWKTCFIFHMLRKTNYSMVIMTTVKRLQKPLSTGTWGLHCS